MLHSHEGDLFILAITDVLARSSNARLKPKRNRTAHLYAPYVTLTAPSAISRPRSRAATRRRSNSRMTYPRAETRSNVYYRQSTNYKPRRPAANLPLAGPNVI